MHSFYSESPLENDTTSYSIRSATLPSTPLSDYIILSPLGRGAASFVYKVQSRKSKKELALKVIDKRQGDPKVLLSRLMNEIKIHSSLVHENIVKLIDSFEDSDNYYILLEFCEEGEFYSYLKSKGRLEEDEIRYYGLQLAKAIKHLHDNKVLHRDLKLGNLLLARDRILKLCDFGLAAKLTDTRPERETLCGTPNYISPEIINKTNYGLQSDCWSYGCILYALATGHPPFEGESVQKTLWNVKKGSLQYPEHLSPDFKDLLKNVITWDSEKRLNISQIIGHSFFIGNKFSFCVPSNPNLTIQMQQQSPSITKIQKSEPFNLNLGKTTQNPLISTPELVKTTERSHPDLKPRQIFPENLDKKPSSTKSIKGISSSLGSKAFFKDFDPHLMNSQTMNPPLIDHPLNSNVLRNTNNTLGMFNKNKENLSGISNRETVAKNTTVLKNVELNKKESIKESRNKDKLANKSIEIQRKSKNDLEEYLKTEADATPRSKKPIKNFGNNTTLLNGFHQGKQAKPQFLQRTGDFNPGFLLLSNNNNVKININTSKIMNTTNNCNEDNIKIITSQCYDSIQDFLIPLSTSSIKPCKFQTKNGTIEIKNDQSLQMEISGGKILLLISGDGKRIFIAKRNDGKFNKSYSLSELPKKYHLFYNYAKKVCETLKQAPLAKISNEIGRFSLTKCSNDLNFEAFLHSGYRILYTIGGKSLAISKDNGEELSVDIKEKIGGLGKEMQKAIRTSFNYIDECLRIYEKSKKDLEAEL